MVCDVFNLHPFSSPNDFFMLLGYLKSIAKFMSSASAQLMLQFMIMSEANYNFIAGGRTARSQPSEENQ